MDFCINGTVDLSKSQRAAVSDEKPRKNGLFLKKNSGESDLNVPFYEAVLRSNHNADNVSRNIRSYFVRLMTTLYSSMT